MFDTALLQDTRKSQRETSSALGEQCLQAMGAAAPVLQDTLARYGNRPLADYLDTLQVSAGSTYQPRQDFLDIYHQEVASLLGDAYGLKASEEIDACPMVLTANHLGVDFFSQSVQSSLLFYLLKRQRTQSPAVIPVLACGSIPLNNVTYPRGVLIYKLLNESYDNIPKKLPVFSDKAKRTLVNVAPAFDVSMVKRALNRVDKLVAQKMIGTQLAETLQQIFINDYEAPEVLSLSSYSKQSLFVNNRIWQRLFASDTAPSNIVTLDLENIVSQLLIKDLSNPESLVWAMLDDTPLRKRVIERLNGRRACWNITELQERLTKNQTKETKKKPPTSCGTTFFWGINERSQRIPLLLTKNKYDQWVLRGTDERGYNIELTFNPETIISKLKKGQLLPSIFISYTVLAFARGLTCLGGYYQAEYLPMMQAELVAAMRETGSGNEAAALVENVATGCYLSGMQTVMTEDKDGLVPAGPIEIIAGGGLTDTDLDTILALSVREAHLASLFETIDDIAPRTDKKKELKQALAQNSHLFRDKLVVK